MVADSHRNLRCKGTFNLNKEYKRFLKDGTIPENTKR